MPDASSPTQLPLADLDEREWDVAIVGAGPAGCVAAHQLSLNGHSVLLIEREALPRDKVCGDGLLPDALQVLEQLGLLPQVLRRAHASRSTHIFSPARIGIELSGRFLALPRRELDTLLVQAASDRGTTVARGTIVSVRSREGGGVALTARDRAPPIRARLGIIATGAAVSLLEPLGMVSRRQPSAIALRCYVKSSFSLDHWVVSFDRAVAPGYAWAFPLGDGRYNVGCGQFARNRRPWGNLRDKFDRFVTSFPGVRGLLQQASEVDKPVGARLRCGLSGAQVHDGGSVIAVGEAIGATYPFTGEGIGKAMETSLIASRYAHRMLESDDRSILGELARAFALGLAPRYEGYRLAERFMSYPRVADFVARRARSSGRLRRALEGILSESVDPRLAFSLRGLFSVLVG